VVLPHNKYSISVTCECYSKSYKTQGVSDAFPLGVRSTLVVLKCSTKRLYCVFQYNDCQEPLNKKFKKFHEIKILYDDIDYGITKTKRSLSSMYEKCDKLLKVLDVQFVL
jgi:hypothetical protein